GVRTVAVYSDADAGAMHVALADEAVRIGEAPARESYLRIDRVVDAALQARADAVHPGYGFLSENAAFAEACERAGLVFVGPPPAAIRAMGDKSAAKAIMAKAGVPLLPGYHGERQEPAFLLEQARAIGFPVMIKPCAGGGGKGMRVVRGAAELEAALAASRREAASAFGDERVLLERCVERPRHIEIQVFADRHGGCVHLLERDCSIQRRHQKVLEEAPAPGLAEMQRHAMGEAAIAAARAVGYVGAGTVEFIVTADADGAPGDFAFMEMNTRLQVEHPVTEMITGLDLVEWQLRVAAGEPLPLAQAQVRARGHAIEVRLYAEDPERDFLPSTGRLAHLRLPEASDRVRVDAGVRAGDEVSPYYDPMLAKLIVHDDDRGAAIARLRAALDAVEVVGVATNVDFLARLAHAGALARAELDTGFVERERAFLFAEPAPAGDEALALATLAVLLEDEAKARAGAIASADPHSPWSRADGWRLNDQGHRVLVFRERGRETAVTVRRRADAYAAEIAGRACSLSGERSADGRITARLGRTTVAGTAVLHAGRCHVFLPGSRHRLELHDALAQELAGDVAGGELAAPMPGKIVGVLVEPGRTVERGTPLVVLEAMKMEHTITAPARGRVTAIHFAAGDQVVEGAELLAFEPEKAAR
ncbi:MAG TPA: biotin carboxylase N-terminal domain-containing protein, partial [Burkholderiales bacterium]|nr:biotin carboxylase N-terminal domain-containing protein [Burkholderiales bacterium]